MNIEEIGNKQVFFNQDQPKEQGCSSCKDKGKDKLTSGQGWMLALSIYILLASVYGTIKIFENISSLF